MRSKAQKRKHLLTAVCGMMVGITCQAAEKPLKVFILAGQSNMEGHAEISTFDYIGKDPLTAPLLKEMRNPDGTPRVCDNVWMSYLTGPYDGSANGEGLGKLTAGFGERAGNPTQLSSKIGPEFTFGIFMDKALDEPILIIKTAWGGKSLFVDFRPPSSGGQVGPYYTKMVEEVHAALAELGDQKYEIVGFVWQQGWNDMCEKPAIAEYAENLVNLVNDLRKEFKAPNLPVVVGELGNGGAVDSGDMFDFRNAQEKGTMQIKNALFIKTTDFARAAEMSPNPGHGHHWCGNAESYFLIGDALGEGMKKLLR